MRKWEKGNNLHEEIIYTKSRKQKREWTVGRPTGQFFGIWKTRGKRVLSEVEMHIRGQSFSVLWTMLRIWFLY